MNKKDGIQIGELVQSLSGHDAGGYFLVTGREGGMLCLCDGKRRKAAGQKRKNPKHVAASGMVCDWVRQHPECVNNTSVRKAIRNILNQTGGENPCQRKTF